MARNDILPFAASAGANVLTQAEYAADAARSQGNQSGLARAKFMNKIWRQSAHMAAGLAQFIANRHTPGVIDDGNVAAVEAGLEAAIRGEVVWKSSVTYGGPGIVCHGGKIWLWLKASGPGVAGVGAKTPGAAGSEGVWLQVPALSDSMRTDFSNAVGSAPNSHRWNTISMDFTGKNSSPNFVFGTLGGVSDAAYPHNVDYLHVGKAKSLEYNNPSAGGYTTITGVADTNGAAMYFTSFNNYGAQIVLGVSRGGEANFTATVDGSHNLGLPYKRWKDVYCVNGAIQTSDERLKHLVNGNGAIEDALFRAWARVRFVLFQFTDAVTEKGELARIHAGLIAQRIKEAFEAEGLDPFRYGLLCYDKWEAQEAVTEAFTGEDGVEQLRTLQPAREAGDRYSLRYEECLCMEAAYQRHRADKAEARLDALEARLDALEGR